MEVAGRERDDNDGSINKASFFVRPCAAKISLHRLSALEGDGQRPCVSMRSSFHV